MNSNNIVTTNIKGEQKKSKITKASDFAYLKSGGGFCISTVVTFRLIVFNSANK